MQGAGCRVQGAGCRAYAEKGSEDTGNGASTFRVCPIVEPLEPRQHALLLARFGSRCRVQGSWFRVPDSGFKVVRVQGSGFKVQGLGFRVWGSGFRVQGSGFRVQGSGFRVQSLFGEGVEV